VPSFRAEREGHPQTPKSTQNCLTLDTRLDSGPPVTQTAKHRIGLTAVSILIDRFPQNTIDHVELVHPKRHDGR
jgi:hypothetical protein